jgi:MFS family permease
MMAPAGTLPMPRAAPSMPPSTVASLDALPKEAEKKAKLAMIWFIVSGVIFMAVGGYLYYILSDALSHDKPVDAVAMWSFISVMFIFGILAVVLAIVTSLRVIGMMHNDKWDTATDTMMFLALPGFLFGLGLSGILLFTTNKKMRKHPFYLRTLPPPTPVCERCRQPVQWMPAMKKWYCPNCHIYL